MNPPVTKERIEQIREYISKCITWAAASISRDLLAYIAQQDAEIAVLKADKERIEWMFIHEAIIVGRSRAMTRRGGLIPENMEHGFVVDYVREDGSEILEGADLIQPTRRAAVDASMKREAARAREGAKL